MRYSRNNPNHPPEPAVKRMDPEGIPAAIVKAKRLLEAHKMRRPSNLDIPALTAWVWEKEHIACGLRMLENQQRGTWKQVPVPQVAS